MKNNNVTLVQTKQTTQGMTLADKHQKLLNIVKKLQSEAIKNASEIKASYSYHY